MSKNKIKVINTGPKVIGLGELHIVQGETVTLPPGFGLDHPTVEYFISMGWLTCISGGGVVLPRCVSPDVGMDKVESDAVDTDNTDNAGADNTDNADADTTEPEIPSRRDIQRMNLEGLKALAGRQGIAFEPDTTRAALIDLLTQSGDSE